MTSSPDDTTTRAPRNPVLGNAQRLPGANAEKSADTTPHIGRS